MTRVGLSTWVLHLLLSRMRPILDSPKSARPIQCMLGLGRVLLTIHLELVVVEVADQPVATCQRD